MSPACRQPQSGLRPVSVTARPGEPGPTLERGFDEVWTRAGQPNPGRVLRRLRRSTEQRIVSEQRIAPRLPIAGSRTAPQQPPHSTRHEEPAVARTARGAVTRLPRTLPVWALGPVTPRRPARPSGWRPARRFERRSTAASSVQPAPRRESSARMQSAPMGERPAWSRPARSGARRPAAAFSVRPAPMGERLAWSRPARSDARRPAVAFPMRPVAMGERPAPERLAAAPRSAPIPRIAHEPRLRSPRPSDDLLAGGRDTATRSHGMPGRNRAAPRRFPRPRPRLEADCESAPRTGRRRAPRCHRQGNSFPHGLPEGHTRTPGRVPCAHHRCDGWCR